jgi:5-methylcytosine-specific restriction endonuclease McrA
MPTKGTGDPLLRGRDWQDVRAYWRQRRLPCARCGSPIDYDTPHSPRSLDVGHIVPRDQAKAMGWPRERINAITNTQPECRTCSRSAGAIYGNAKRFGLRPCPVEADEW